MGRHHSHLTSAVSILEKYHGSMPFNNFIKAYFSKEKKYGSRDRRQIAALCYAFFRSGYLLKKGDTAEKIINSVFLSEQSHSDFLAEVRPGLNAQINSELSDKFSFIGKVEADIFPFLNELSEDIEKDLFLKSLFIQPLLFLRVRPGKDHIVQQKLTAANIPFTIAPPDCVVLDNGTKVEEFLKINDEVVIQDRNSQRVLDYLTTAIPSSSHTLIAWDCCAGSGGKSILLHDRLRGKLRLTVADIRETILSRLHTRLHNAGVPFENSYLKDLTESGLSNSEKFDIVLCDAPCTGSGTWSRTPEQLYYFQRSKIQMYAEMQRKIINHSIKTLHKGSLFFYITCSVFSEENEQQANFITQTFKVKQVHLEYLKGYLDKADTMFVAVFKKS